MHASIFVEQYVVLPWGRYRRSSDVIHLVDAATRDSMVATG
jgi:hypothetical protein